MPLPTENIELSLVLPAYNEATRLPPYLATIRTHLSQRYGNAYEVIVVDDGSTDGLAQELERWGADWPQLRCLKHERNQGKGAAVRTGILAAQGQLLLFADADGATPIAEEWRLVAAIQSGADVAVGSRLLAVTGLQRQRHWLRGLAGRLFASIARRCLRLSVRDTQCGFKMFRHQVGKRLFATAREPGFFLDLEVLALARRFSYQTAEVPVNWHEVSGSHVNLLRLVPHAVTALWRIRRRVREAV
jgi:dolichyl-phosphate beta-glucosyltransferase